MATATITSKGQTTIPKEVRAAANLKPGPVREALEHEMEPWVNSLTDEFTERWNRKYAQRNRQSDEPASQMFHRFRREINLMQQPSLDLG